MYNSTQYNTYYHEISNGHECYPPSTTISSPYNTSTYLSRTNSNLSLQNSSYYQQHQLEQTHNFYDQKEEIYDLHGGEKLRRVFSTEDILDPYASGNSHIPFGAVSSGSSSSTSSPAMGKVGRYSAEERKERIERYKSKRIHRNFQKKITYECRKILADSRRRVRGRFARNGEPDMEIEAETTSNGRYGWIEEEEKGMNTSMESTSSTMGTTGEDYCHDSELWQSFVGDCFSFSNFISLD